MVEGKKISFNVGDHVAFEVNFETRTGIVVKVNRLCIDVKDDEGGPEWNLNTFTDGKIISLRHAPGAKLIMKKQMDNLYLGNLAKMNQDQVKEYLLSGHFAVIYVDDQGLGLIKQQ